MTQSTNQKYSDKIVKNMKWNVWVNNNAEAHLATMQSFSCDKQINCSEECLFTPEVMLESQTWKQILVLESKLWHISKRWTTKHRTIKNRIYKTKYQNRKKP